MCGAPVAVLCKRCSRCPCRLDLDAGVSWSPVLFVRCDKTVVNRTVLLRLILYLYATMICTVRKLSQLFMAMYGAW